MSRVSPPLTISEQDQAILEAMCTADGEQSTRAKIILASTQNKQNKDIANSLGVQPNTVSKWKEAYRTKGLDGIRVVHAGGRPSKYAESEDIPVMIAHCLEMHPDWKAGDIANELNLPSAKVYYELGRMEVNLQRSRRWTYSSSDSICQWNPSLILVYRTYECSVLVASKSTGAWEGKAVGTFETRNRLLKEELERSVVPVTLPGMLFTAKRFTQSPASGNDKPPEKYVTKAIDGWCDYQQDRVAEFHIFSFGGNPTYQGSSQVPCYYHTFASEEEMASSYTHWMGSTCSGIQHIAVENLMECLKDYGQAVEKETAGFVWYSSKPTAEKQASQTEPFIHQKDTEGMSALMEGLNLSESEYLELIEALASLTKGTDVDGTSVGAILCQVDSKDGSRHFKLVPSGIKFQDYRDFDFSSREGFTRDISRLTEDSDDFGDKIAMANDELFLDVAKKNKI